MLLNINIFIIIINLVILMNLLIKLIKINAHKFNLKINNIFLKLFLNIFYIKNFKEFKNTKKKIKLKFLFSIFFNF